MRISALLSTLLIALSGLPTSAQSPRAGQIPQPCTSLKPGNPRFSSGIGIVFPDWALPPNDYEEVVAASREALRDYLTRRITLR